MSCLVLSYYLDVWDRTGLFLLNFLCLLSFIRFLFLKDGAKVLLFFDMSDHKIVGGTTIGIKKATAIFCSRLYSLHERIVSKVPLVQ